MSKQAIFKGPGKRERITLGEAVVTITLASEQTGGELAVLEYDVPAGFPGPPLHVHPGFDEFFYVLEGEMQFRLREETIAGIPGTSVYAPGDWPHTFSNPSRETARLLIVLSPGGFEQFFRDIAAAAGGRMPPPEVAERLNAEHGVHVVG
jgi:quercetin dioxygenase-like cupin family protein